MPALGPARTGHSIAMWGAPGSGKTTFLAALNIALLRKAGPWRVVGADAPSTGFLSDRTTELTQLSQFPEATRGIDHYRWFLIGEPAERRRTFRWWRRRGRPADAPRIGLNLLDPPGGDYLRGRSGHGGGQKELLENLVRSRGIVFLFDPIREFEKGDAFSYLYSTLAQIAEQMLGTEEFADGKLPHHLAVCITKFDDLRVYRTAEKLGLLTIDPEDEHGFPRVEDDEAAELFRELCAISASGSADMVLNALEQFFRRDCIKYFVTSSIGFYLDPRTAGFDPDDFQNLLPDAKAGDGGGGRGAPGTGTGAGARIRGQAHPINVMEPVLWLGQRLAAEPAEGEDRR